MNTPKVMLVVVFSFYVSVAGELLVKRNFLARHTHLQRLAVREFQLHVTLLNMKPEQ